MSSCPPQSISSFGVEKVTPIFLYIIQYAYKNIK
nr:MAG TPA: hypothetical protein [Caudoviricetes sp.]